MANWFRRPKKVAVPNGTSSKVSKNSSVMHSITKQRQPLDYLRTKGIVVDEESDEELKRVRELCRSYYRYSDLIPMIITIYANFPLQGMRIVCQNDDQQALFEKQFMDPSGLDYVNYLPEVGKEYFKVGEVNSFGIFDKQTKWWLSEEILNPDDVGIEDSIFADEEVVTLNISQAFKDALGNTGSAQEQFLKEVYPDIAEAIQQNRNVVLNEDFIYRIVEKADPWDTRGTPIMTRAFEPLLQMETLNAAQDAIADRLYSPMVLAKLGIPANEMGKNQDPWIPTQQNLDSFAETFDKALAADFRVLVHHFGIDIRSVFGRESMPNLSNDFDRLEKRIMRAFGIGQSLLDGSNQGAYASSAINRDFVSQLMATYQRRIQSLFYERARIFSESRNIYEVETGKDGKEVVKKEIFSYIDENGKVIIKERPVVFVPKLVFSSNPLRDPSFEVNLLMSLKQAGVPVSDQTIIDASTLDIELDTELSRISEENVEKKLSEISATTKMEDRLSELDIDTSQLGMAVQEEKTERLSPDQDIEEQQHLELETNTYKPSKELP